MIVLNDVLGYKNLKIYQNKSYFSFSLDSILLANFVDIRYKDKNILDLCSGNGIVPLILALRSNKHIVGVEILEQVAKLAIDSVKYNGFEDKIDIINMDLKKYYDKSLNGKFDIVTCNPPYFKVNEKNFFNDSYEKSIARHEIKVNLDEVLFYASKFLNNNGNFALVHRTDRLIEILENMRKYNLEPKIIRFVHEKIDVPSTLVLIQCQKNGKCGLKIKEPLILYDEDGNFSNEYFNLINEVKK